MPARATDPIARWFDRRGFALLLRGTPLHQETSTRALPAMLALFIVVMLVLVPLSTPADLAPAVGLSIAVIAICWLAGRLVRWGPGMWRMDRVRWPDMVAFVIGPVIAVGIPSYGSDLPGDPSGDGLGSIELSGLEAKLITMAALAVLQIGLLVTVLLLTSLGVWSLSRWLLVESLRSLRTTGTALATSLPVILGVVFFFLLNPGVWLVIGRLPGSPYATVIVLLLALAGAFLGSRSQLDLGSLVRFDSTADLREALAGTPRQDADVTPPGPTPCPLDRRQTLDVRLVAILSRLVVAAVLALAVLAFFLVLGYLTIDGEIISGWPQSTPSVLLEHTAATRTYVLTWEHLKVAGFLATFAALNFSLAFATDARLRVGTSDRATRLVRQACAMRLTLLRLGTRADG